MASTIDISALTARMQEKNKDFERIFAQRTANGFHAKGDMVNLGISDKVTLTRETLSNITQPGLSGKINNKEGDFLQYKQRIGELKPAKADLYIDELMLKRINLSFLSNKQPADLRNIHSLAGADYIMSRIFAQIGKEVNASIYRGELGYGYDNTDAETDAASRFQGGLNLMDGLKLKQTMGYATAGPGAVGDIPGANKVVGAAATMSKTNILDEIAKLEEIILANPELEFLAYGEDDEAGTGSIYIPANFRAYIADALDNLAYKADKLVEVDGAGYRLKKLPKVKFKTRRWMSATNNMFFTTDDNLFYLHQDVDVDIPKIKIQELGRGIQILMDWELGVDYADGRVKVLWK